MKAKIITPSPPSDLEPQGCELPDRRSRRVGPARLGDRRRAQLSSPRPPANTVFAVRLYFKLGADDRPLSSAVLSPSPRSPDKSTCRAGTTTHSPPIPVEANLHLRPCVGNRLWTRDKSLSPTPAPRSHQVAIRLLPWASIRPYLFEGSG